MLSEDVAAGLRARKSFVNLDRQWDLISSDTPSVEEGAWVTHGFLAERTSIKRDSDGLLISFYHWSGFGPIMAASSDTAYDYLEAPIEARQGIPEKFNGMSGGGLWQVPLRMSEAGGDVSYESPVFSGVIYFQQPISSTECRIRCHGRESCYLMARDFIKKHAF